MLRTGETGNSLLNPPEKNLQRKLWVAQELFRERERRTINSLSRRETGVVLRGKPEAKHHQSQVLNPV